VATGASRVSKTLDWNKKKNWLGLILLKAQRVSGGTYHLLKQMSNIFIRDTEFFI
jgi:hypothetical protein